jgi:hypothetical protein
MALDKFYESIINDPDYKNASLKDKELVFQNLIATRPDFREASNEQQMAILQGLGLMEGEAPKPERTQAEQMIREQSQAEQIQQEQPQGGAPSETPAVSDTAAILGGGAALKGVAETLLPKPTGTSAAEVARAAERFAVAQDRLREAQRAMAAGPAGQMGSVQDLQDAFNAAKAEVIAAQQAAKGVPPAARVEPSLVPTADQQTRGIQGTMKDEGITGRASQTTYNERTAQIARQKEAQQAVLQQLAKQGLIDPAKAYQLTEGISGSTPSGVMVSPEEAMRLEQELNQKKSQMATEKAGLGQRAQALGSQTREAERLARKVAEEEAKARVAQEAAERAKAAKVGPLSQIGSNVASRKLLGPLLGGLAGVGTAMSVDEAIKRYRAGDYSGAVIPTLEAVFGGMSMVPPIGPLAAVKGLGTAGGLSLLGIEGGKAAYDYLRRKLKEREEEEKKNATRGQ